MLTHKSLLGASRFLLLRLRSHPTTTTATTTPTFVNLFVNGKPVQVKPGSTVMQACQQAGHEVPHFCYHSRLAIAGNCRMCLVEVEKSAKPVASCAMPASQGMKVWTDSPLAKKAREGILEFILLNHPLDCPICDQGGECDLQDLSVLYGSDKSRFTDVRYGGKRCVIDKDFGPLIRTSFTKCIHCTRCVRFANEIAGVPDLGTTGRGTNTQIGTYIERLLMSELSGNVIDLCPVGALTSKPYSFTARPWENRKTESIDIMDALGSNIVVFTRANQLMKIQPRLNEEINEEWLSDKARFAYDGLKIQRLAVPMIAVNGGLMWQFNWTDVLKKLSSEVMIRVEKGQQIAAVVGDVTDCETVVAMKDFLSSLKQNNNLYLECNIPVGKDRNSYLLNAGIAGIEEADLIFLVNTNPRYEAPLLNTRIRKAWRSNANLNIASVGPTNMDLTYNVTNLGLDMNSVKQIMDGQNQQFNQLLAKSKNPMLILGVNETAKAMDLDILRTYCQNIASGMQQRAKSTLPAFNLLHMHASSVGALDLGCRPSVDGLASSKPGVVFLLNCDRDVVKKSDFPESTVFVYIGHQGDQGVSMADIVLPGCAYTEKNATFVNTEGRVQRVHKALSPPGLARVDWKIVRALSEFCRITLPYDSDEQIRKRLVQENSNFAVLNVLKREPIDETSFANVSSVAHGNSKLQPGIMNLSDYWMTNAITRSSEVMASCVKACQDQPKLQQSRG